MPYNLPLDEEVAQMLQDARRFNSAKYGPSSSSDPVIPVIPSLLQKLDPSALDKVALDYGEEEEEEPEMFFELEGDDAVIDKETLINADVDSDLEILDEALASFLSPKKKRVVKVKERLDDAFLRRSKRVAEKAEGFKDAESAKNFKSGKMEKKPKDSKKPKKPRGAKKATEQSSEILEVTPLAMISPTGNEVAPHLPFEVQDGIGQGFLQIEPEVVSAAPLNKDDLDV